MVLGLKELTSRWFSQARASRPAGPWVRRQTAMPGMYLALDTLSRQGRNQPLLNGPGQPGLASARESLRA